jgi:hypothetical protein
LIKGLEDSKEKRAYDFPEPKIKDLHSISKEELKNLTKSKPDESVDSNESKSKETWLSVNFNFKDHKSWDRDAHQDKLKYGFKNMFKQPGMLCIKFLKFLCINTFK